MNNSTKIDILTISVFYIYIISLIFSNKIIFRSVPMYKLNFE